MEVVGAGSSKVNRGRASGLAEASMQPSGTGQERIIVQKYGGSSVADAARLGQVAARVARTAAAGYRVVVVVSAMGKTTDQLLALAREVSPDPPRREVDMLISTGERISMALLAMALARLGVDAISFTGSQSGIITDDRHAGARILEVRPLRIQEALARGEVVIVAGFQGVSARREITTLGRGGSDTTAVALAAALSAEYCEICSDVDGVYSADPRVVPEARRIDGLGYEVMQELAEHGARVLHAQAVEWARRAGIVVHAVATADPPVAAGGRGTIISAIAGEGDVRTGGGAAVAGSRRLLRVRVAAAGGPALLGLLADEGVRLRRFAVDGERAQALFAVDDLPDLGRVEGALRARLGGVTIDECGEVAVVGPGVGADARKVDRLLEAAWALAGPSECEATPLRLSVYPACAQVDAVTRRLHALAVEGESSGPAAGEGAGRDG